MSSTVLITGASTGIGYELANLYAKDKFHVILVARGKEKLEQVAAELTKDYGCDTTVIACDLSEPKAAQELYDQVKAKNLQVDELINNAGFGNSGSFHERYDMVLYLYPVWIKGVQGFRYLKGSLVHSDRYVYIGWTVNLRVV